MEKGTYIFDHILWNIILFMWGKHLLFCCLSGFTYSESLLILGLIILLVTVAGIAMTWKDKKSFLNILGHIITAWGIYTAIAYLDFFKTRLILIGGITLVITILMILLILFYKMKRPMKRKRVIRRKMRMVIRCVHRNVIISMVIFVFPIVISSFFRGTILNAEVEATRVYGEEHSLDANMEIIADIDPERWERLDLQQRLNVCQTIINCEAYSLGLSHEVSVGVVEMKEAIVGGYDAVRHHIAIDINHLRNEHSYEILNTLIHEITHAYQHEQVHLYQTLDEKYRNLALFSDASVYVKEFANYQNTEDGVEEYYNQKVEADAREAAEIKSTAYIQWINEYWEKMQDDEEY